MEQLPSASLLEADWQWWASTETGKSPIKRTRGGGERWSSIEQSPASKVDLSLFDVITSSLWCRRMYARPTPRHFRYNAKAKSLYGALKRNSKKFTSAAAADFFFKRFASRQSIPILRYPCERENRSTLVNSATCWTKRTRLWKALNKDLGSRNWLPLSWILHNRKRCSWLATVESPSNFASGH